MQVRRIEIDSAILARDVLELAEITVTDNVAQLEQAYLRQYQPYYVSCKIPIEDIAVIHLLTRHGFQLIECQLRLTTRITHLYDVSRFAYRFNPVETEEQLAQVLAVATSTFDTDRFSIDPAMPGTVSAERYRRYIRKSFSTPEESIYQLTDPESGEVLAFETHRYSSDKEIVGLLGGVNPCYKNLGLGAIYGYYQHNLLYQQGIRRIITHISSANYGVANIQFGMFGYKITQTFAVLRKIYADAGSAT